MQHSLKLNSRSVINARNQYRVWSYIHQLGQILDVNVSQDKYIADILLTSDILEKLISQIQIPVISSPLDISIFQVFDLQITSAQKSIFIQNIISINTFASKIDSTISSSIPFDDYFEFIHQMIKIFTAIQKVEYMPKLDFNSDEFVLDYQASEDEVKIFINIEGVQCLDIQDINNDLKQEPKFYQNRLWVVYVMVFVASCGLQVSFTNISYYIQVIGATASQVTSQTTYFNLAQLFFSVFWLWLSDKIGRKPIALIMVVVYTITTGIFLVTVNLTNSQNIILIITIIRASQGSVAIIVPLAVTIVSDLATPKIRGFVMILVNVSAQLGSVMQSAIQLYFSNAAKYDTRNPSLPFDEVQARSTLSFRDSHITATVIFAGCLVFVSVFLKESNQRVLTMRKTAALGLSIKNVKQMNTTPMYRVCFQMIKDINIILLFISYFLSLTGAINSRTGAPFYTTRTYGFTNANQAKGYSATVQLVSITLGALFSAFISKYLIKFLGEYRSIVLSQYISIAESLIYFLPNPPVPQPLMFLTMLMTGLASIFCDSIFLQLASMYTVPQNRGQVMGVFQIGNSIGRIISGAITGAMYDYNYRDGQLFNTMFQSVCLFLLAFIKPPLLRTEMDQLGLQREKESKNEAIV
ncbi:Major facilitator superfamily protein [Spironucleus salmonicida]|uniref:Major facilitator superfamily protein n=1 Tax=Spironucleus salmonicida TaxID=348837 RepID=V6LFP0_9EUKA|nr:Major facilitator superfamily protein [Spironucleus salmonicida]|eukprot:EST43312.1 Major facilitator superfamily protein [Spironucleus salmonicida]